MFGLTTEIAATASIVADANGAVTISFPVPVRLAQGSYAVDLTAADGDLASTSFTLRSLWQDVLAHIVRLLTTGG